MRSAPAPPEATPSAAAAPDRAELPMLQPAAHPALRRLGIAAGWLAALALVGWLLWHVTWAEFWTAWSRGASFAFTLWIVALALAPLPFDAWATRRALAHLDLPVAFDELLLARGASYLPGLLNYAVGQGGLALYLAQRGAGVAKGAAALLFLGVTQALALVTCATPAALAGLPPALRAPVGWSLALGVAGGLAYLVVVAVGARHLPVLRRWRPLALLLEAGVAGHLRATVARLPHLLVMNLLTWGALRIWGIAVPAAVALTLLPYLLLLAALPLTPGGLGTVQAAQVFLFAPFAPGASTAAQHATVLACGLTGQVLGMLVQAAMGLTCLVLLARRRRAAAVAGETG